MRLSTSGAVAASPPRRRRAAVAPLRAVHGLAVAVALSASPSAEASAQGDSARRVIRDARDLAPTQTRYVTGVVFDSLTMRPLGGARVALGETEPVTTDSLGRFAVAVVETAALGSRLLVARHPAIDSVGLSRLSRSVDPKRDSSVMLAIPSFATLRAAACARGVDGGDAAQGILYGVVRSAATQAPVAGARVTVRWIETNKKSEHYLQPAALEARATARGEWYVCGLPLGTDVTVQADSGRISSGAITLGIGERRVLRRDLAVGEPGDTARPAYVLATVRRPDGAPIPQARLRLGDGPEVRADDDGRAMLRVAAVGTHTVGVVALGYQPKDVVVDLVAGDTTRTEIRMTSAAVTLATVTVRAERMNREIARRQMMGFAQTFTADQLEKIHTWSSLVTKINAPQIRTSIIAPVVYFRNPGGGLCQASWYLDGRRTGSDEVAAWSPDELYAVEAFPRSMNAPHQYVDARKSCGVIMVWTKDWVNR